MVRPVRTYKQEVTWWQIIPGDDGFGKKNFNGPVTFKGRWETKSEQIVTKTGETTFSKAAIFYPDNINIQIDDWLCLGRVTDANPVARADTYQVMQLNIMPDLRNLTKINVAVV